MALEKAGETPVGVARNQRGLKAGWRSRAGLAWIGLAALPLLMAGCLSRSLTSLQIMPTAGSVSVVVGQSSQFQAVGVFTESGHATTSKDVSGQVSWLSSNPAVATISATGLATGVAVGTATITGTMQGDFGTVSATSNITVLGGGASTQRVLTQLAVTPTTQTITGADGTAQLIAIGTYSNGSPATQDLTAQAAWQSSDVTVATVNTTGLVTAVGVGQVTISALATATDGSIVSGSSAITVASGPSQRILASLSVTPTTQTVASSGGTAQLIAIGTYSSGSPATQNLTTEVAWQTSDAAVATVSSAGVVKGLAVGQATITALATASDGSVISASSAITITAGASQRVLASLIVIPSTLQLVTATGETTQFLAIGTYSSGSPATQDLTNQVAWTSSDTSVALINSSGLATATGVGESTITALATASDGSVITAVGTIQDTGAAGTVNLPTLSVYKVGSGSGTVTGASVIDCGTGSGCVGNFPVGTTVTLVAAPVNGSRFDGWSANCAQVANMANECTLTVTNTNTTVGAVFDLD